jgi:3-oxoacyl-[acyl-carrier protein] reductase
MTGRTTPPATTALVTGANRGLGRVIALGLAEAGVTVGLLGRSTSGLRAVADEITADGGRCAVAQADVRVFDDVRRAVARIEGEFGGIDLLVNNAGVIDPVEEPVWEADPGDWWDVVETDLRGPFHLVRAVVPGMIERRAGRVINLNSGAGALDRTIYSAYSAAKAGLFRITGNLHLAGHDRGLRAFEVSPGTARTDMTAAMPLHRQRTEWTAPEAVAELMVAVGRGELDAWSGCFLRAGLDTPESLRKAAVQLSDGDGGSGVPAPIRRLGVIPWGPADPLAAERAPIPPST